MDQVVPPSTVSRTVLSVPETHTISFDTGARPRNCFVVLVGLRSHDKADGADIGYVLGTATAEGSSALSTTDELKNFILEVLEVFSNSEPEIVGNMSSGRDPTLHGDL